jgi:ribosomal-protein-alanine acetyltransferase
VNQSNNLLISNLTAQDVPDLEEVEGLTGLSFWGVDHYKRFLEQPEYFGRKAVAALAPGASRLVAFFLARSILENLELLKIGVCPIYQKRGIGARLLNAAFTEGLKRGCLRCFLEVRKSNHSAIQFYYGHQFKLAGERLNYYTEPAEDAWVMERWL